MFNCISTPLTQAEIITVLGSAPYAIFRTCKHPYSIPITFDYTWDNNQLCFELFTGALHRGICPGQKVCLEFQTTAPGGIVQIVTVEGRIVKDCNGNPTILSGSGCGCYCGCQQTTGICDYPCIDSTTDGEIEVFANCVVGRQYTLVSVPIPVNNGTQGA